MYGNPTSMNQNMAMTKRNQGTSEPSLVMRGRIVNLPPSMATFQLGQRLYFCQTSQGILLTVVPKRTWHGRLLSTRVRRTVCTLAAFGPRATWRPAKTCDTSAHRRRRRKA